MINKEKSIKNGNSSSQNNNNSTYPITKRKVFITEKPSVAREFAKVLNVVGNKDGYIENNEYIITWCIGHLVSMSYPDKYDQSLKKWSLETLPFIPEIYLYEVIENVSKWMCPLMGSLALILNAQEK